MIPFERPSNAPEQGSNGLRTTLRTTFEQPSNGLRTGYSHTPLYPRRSKAPLERRFDAQKIPTMTNNKTNIADLSTAIICSLTFTNRGDLVLTRRRRHGRNLDPQLWAHLESQSGDDPKPAKPPRQRQAKRR